MIDFDPSRLRATPTKPTPVLGRSTPVARPPDHLAAPQPTKPIITPVSAPAPVASSSSGGIRTEVRNGKTVYFTADGRSWSTMGNAEAYLNSRGGSVSASSPSPSQPSTPQPQSYQPPSTSKSYADAEAAMEEARRKTEASKQAALGYYAPIEERLSQMGDLITPEQKQQLMASRRSQLANAGQNLTEAFGDADSGIQQGRRAQFALGTANAAANLPIQTELDIGQANRAAQMDILGRRATIAGQKGNIEMGYEYDPGMDYISQMAEALGTSADSILGTVGGGIGAGGVSDIASNITAEAAQNPEVIYLQNQIKNIENEIATLRGTGSIYDTGSYTRRVQLTNKLNKLKTDLAFMLNRR